MNDYFILSWSNLFCLNITTKEGLFHYYLRKQTNTIIMCQVFKMIFNVQHNFIFYLICWYIPGVSDLQDGNYGISSNHFNFMFTRIEVVSVFKGKITQSTEANKHLWRYVSFTPSIGGSITSEENKYSLHINSSGVH